MQQYGRCTIYFRCRLFNDRSLALAMNLASIHPLTTLGALWTFLKFKGLAAEMMFLRWIISTETMICLCMYLSLTMLGSVRDALIASSSLRLAISLLYFLIRASSSSRAFWRMLVSVLCSLRNTSATTSFCQGSMLRVSFMKSWL